MTEAVHPPHLKDDFGEAQTALAGAGLTSLATFSEIMKEGYDSARVHLLLAKKLEDCFARKIRRLVISIAPRHGKSLLSSIMFPSWALTKDPRIQVVQASYSADLSETFSRQAKAVVTSAAYQQIYPPLLSPRLNRQNQWETLAGGSFYSVGVGGGIVGRGADILLVDDAHKNREEAESESARQKVWDWFTGDALTRLSPQGVAIVIGTRWHEDDLIGRLTNPEYVRQFEEKGLSTAKFEVLNLEAICEHPESDPMRRKFGEALWPERWSIAHLEERKIAIGSREFSAQYQGRPTPSGGDLFDTTKIRYIERERVPGGVEVVRAWDLAISTKASADYTVGALGCMGKDGNFYLIDVHRAKRSWGQQRQMIEALAVEDGCTRIGVEAVGGWKVAADELRQSMATAGIRVEPLEVATDKRTRALPWAALIEAGKFYVMKASWNADFVHELQGFPAGTHDDQVDAVSLLYRMIWRQTKLFVA